MNKPRFSIVVPVYKTQNYIRQCMESILAQTYENYEVILVDDGSPDRSGEICDEYAAQDARFRVIHKENGGLVSARKAGAEVCMGDYVVNVDSDDYIADDLLERLSNIISEHEPDVVCYDAYRFFPDGQMDFAGTATIGLYTDTALEELRDCFIRVHDYRAAILYSLCAKAVKRSLYIEYQMKVPNELVIGEDMAVTGTLLVGSKSVFVSGYRGYYYRANPRSIMHTFKKDEVAQIELLAKYLKKNMRETDQRRIDGYVLMRYFGFLHHLAWASESFSAFMSVVKETDNEYIDACVQRAASTGGSVKARLVYFLTKHRAYWLIWLLSHLKRRE